MSVKVGVIGFGMGSYHCKCYEANPRSDLVAICDLDAARLERAGAQYPKAHLYTQYEDMFAKEKLDAVSVALPNVLHAPVTLAAIEAGLHVLCEKPMSVDAVSAEKMWQAALAAHKKLMIHLNYRFSPASQWAKRFVTEGNLGKVYYARTRWLRARGIPRIGSWFGIKAMSGGGPMIDLGVHRLDLALWLLGYPKALTVSAATHGDLGRRLAREAKAKYDVEDLVSAFVRLENGITLALEASWAGGTDEREEMMTGIYGDAGAIVQRNQRGGYEFETLGLLDISGALTQVTPKSLPGESASAVDHFVDCVADDKQPDPSAENGVALMRIIDAVYQSAREGREVRLSE
jgi:predicted dehydrogenase